MCWIRLVKDESVEFGYVKLGSDKVRQGFTRLSRYMWDKVKYRKGYENCIWLGFMDFGWLKLAYD